MKLLRLSLLSSRLFSARENEEVEEEQQEKPQRKLLSNFVHLEEAKKKKKTETKHTKFLLWEPLKSWQIYGPKQSKEVAAGELKMT